MSTTSPVASGSPRRSAPVTVPATLEAEAEAEADESSEVGFSGSSPRVPRTFEALGNLEYRKFFIGHGISLVGTWLQGAAVAWIVFETTRDERMLGLVEAANLMPGVVVGLLAGMVADQVTPRRMVLAMQFGQFVVASTLAALALIGWLPVPLMLAALVVARVCVTFEMPSRQVLIYDVVGRGHLMNAIALNTGLFNASRVVGPSLAGVVLATLGAPACFVLNAVSFTAAMTAVGLMRVRPKPPNARAGDNATASKGWKGALAGFAHLGRDRLVGGLFLMLSGFGVLGMGYSAMIPSYAQVVLGVREIGYSLLLASSGVGATLGALIVASLGPGRDRLQVIALGLVLFAVGLAAAAVVPPLVAGGASGSRLALATAMACLSVVGCGAIMVYSTTQTVIQAAVPDAIRGRIMGVWMIMFSASVPSGALVSGVLASWLGTPQAMLAGSIGVALLALVVGVAFNLISWRANPPIASDTF